MADEQRLPVGRARTLAVGVGLTAAVELPLVLFGALPDSTILFAALTLAGCLLMTRILARPVDAADRRTLSDGRLVGLGVVLGLAALTRNEVAWLALTWVLLAWRWGPRGLRLRLVAVPGLIAFLIFAPWMIRDWLVFGNPLPGQALANALSVTGFDIFAWSDPPTLVRYLALGPGRLLQLRLDGLGHNLVNVLLVPGFPVALIGLLALPWSGRLRTLRPLLIVSLITFLVTSLALPGLDHVGDVPPRGGGRAGPAHRELPGGTRRRDRPAGCLARLASTGRLAGADPDDLRVAPPERDPRVVRHPGR